jgi:hypothetical protein
MLLAIEQLRFGSQMIPVQHIGLLHVLQDHLLPFMSDSRHPPDTLFLVLEEDWRCYEAECNVSTKYLVAQHPPAVQMPTGMRDDLGEYEVDAEDVLDATIQAAPWNKSEAVAGQPSAPGEPFAPGAGGDTLEQPKVVSGENMWYTRPSRVKGDAAAPTEELQDIVKLCTAAHRRGKGGLVWLSWDGGSTSGRKLSPCHASTLLAVSHLTAVVMLSEFEKFSFRHFDLALRARLEEEEGCAARYQASYVCKSIGHYVGHLSGCQEGLGFRRADWQNSWVQEGVRPRAGQEDRWLCDFSRSGGPNYICKVSLPERGDEDLRWKTQRPPKDGDTTEESEDDDQSGWKSRKTTSSVSGSAGGDPAKGQKSSSGAGSSDLSKKRAQFLPGGYEWPAENTSRSRRRFRHYLSMSSRRFFVDEKASRNDRHPLPS